MRPKIEFVCGMRLETRAFVLQPCFCFFGNSQRFLSTLWRLKLFIAETHSTIYAFNSNMTMKNGSVVGAAKPDKANGVKANGVAKANGLAPPPFGNSLQVPSTSNGMATTAINMEAFVQPVPIQIKRPPFAFRILVSSLISTCTQYTSISFLESTKCTYGPEEWAFWSGLHVGIDRHNRYWPNEVS